MSTEPKEPTAKPEVVLDAQHPWPGLHAFSEQNRGHFRGRDDETGDLARRVRRKLLTVLFGVSGLGKTSLLQAGLAPALEDSEFLPVLVRLDHTAERPLLEQVREAVARAMRAAGIQNASPGAAEDLWSFFHRRAGAWKDAAGKPRTAVLIFDQFEEIFTRSRAEADAEAERRYFLNELVALVENTPSDELRHTIERQPELLEEYDFAQESYRIVLSLREDYLPELEDLKQRMPSIMENRLRLTRLNEAQALEAILGPGREVITETVAREIVHFITAAAEAGEGGAGRARQEVDPALLSLMCSELNAQRLAEKHAHITSELLQGRSNRILDDYYTRCFEFLAEEEQRAAARKFVEERLLTPDGHRESVALDSARAELRKAKVPEAALTRLVQQRLLQLDERHGLRRVELTHDVLTKVVGKSAAARKETEKVEEQRRQEVTELAQARESERLASEQLDRARAQRRQYAIGGAVLAALFLAATSFAVTAMLQKREVTRSKEKLEAKQRELEATVRQRKEALAQATSSIKAVEKVTDRFTGQLLEEINQAKGTQVLTLQRIVANGLSAYDELPAELHGASAIEHNRAQLLRISAEIALALDPRGNFEKARSSAEQAVAALHSSGASDGVRLEEDLVQAYLTLSDLYAQYAGSLPATANLIPLYDRADKNCALALEAARRFATLDGKKEASALALSRALAMQGDLLKGRAQVIRTATQREINTSSGLLEEALHRYQTAFDGCTELRGRGTSRAQELQRLIADLRNKMGTVCGMKKDHRTALEHFTEARALRQAIIKQDPDAVQDRQQLAYTINNIGWISRETKDFPKMFKCYEERLEISKGIAARDPLNFTYQVGLAEAYRHLGQAYLEAAAKDPKNGDLALTNYQKAVEVTDGKSAKHLEKLVEAAEKLKRNEVAAAARKKLNQTKISLAENRSEAELN